MRLVVAAQMTFTTTIFVGAGISDQVGQTSGPRWVGLRCRDGTDDLIADIKRQYDGAEILINNAGASSNKTVMEARRRDWPSSSSFSARIAPAIPLA